MNQDPREILKTILEIIGYEGDREQFAAQFLESVFKQAFVEYYTTLSESQKKVLDTQFGDGNEANVGRFDQLAQEDSHFSEALRTSAESMISSYVEEIMPSLSDAQKNKLQEYLKSLSPDNGS